MFLSVFPQLFPRNMSKCSCLTGFPWFICHHKICRLINQVTSSGENLPAPFCGRTEGWREEMCCQGSGEGPWILQGDATAPSHLSKDSVEDIKRAGQQGEDPSAQNNSSSGKLRGNTATRKTEAALWLLFYSLRRRACPGSKHLEVVAAVVCQEKEVGLIVGKELYRRCAQEQQSRCTQRSFSHLLTGGPPLIWIPNLQARKPTEHK